MEGDPTQQCLNGRVPVETVPRVPRFMHDLSERHGRRTPRLSEAAVAMLPRYSWPGNVRELQHVIERAVLLSRGGVLRLDGALAEPEETTRAKSNESTPVALQAVIPEIEWRRRERENVRTALQLAKGRIYGPDGAADILGVKPTTLISRLNALGLREPPKRPRRR